VSTGDLIARLLPSLVILFGALFALRWWARRQGTVGGQLVRVVSRTGLSRGAMLAVVQVGDKRLLVGATDHAVNVLTELPPEDPAEPDEAAAGLVLKSSAGRADVNAAPRDGAQQQGPRMGLVDRLREMTVRSNPPRPPRDRS
jgi:flagellar biogenesis protein FliO